MITQVHCQPPATPATHATAAVLACCDGQRTVEQIQATVLRDHPDLFPTSGEVSDFVTKVLGRDCEP